MKPVESIRGSSGVNRTQREKRENEMNRRNRPIREWHKEKDLVKKSETSRNAEKGRDAARCNIRGSSWDRSLERDQHYRNRDYKNMRYGDRGATMGTHSDNNRIRKSILDEERNSRRGRYLGISLDNQRDKTRSSNMANLYDRNNVSFNREGKKFNYAQKIATGSNIETREKRRYVTNI